MLNMYHKNIHKTRRQAGGFNIYIETNRNVALYFVFLRRYLRREGRLPNEHVRFYTGETWPLNMHVMEPLQSKKS